MVVVVVAGVAPNRSDEWDDAYPLGRPHSHAHTPTSSEAAGHTAVATTWLPRADDTCDKDAGTERAAPPSKERKGEREGEGGGIPPK